MVINFKIILVQMQVLKFKVRTVLSLIMVPVSHVRTDMCSISKKIALWSILFAKLTIQQVETAQAVTPDMLYLTTARVQLIKV
jgi:hypothetical protein